jgi:hypothetical protein
MDEEGEKERSGGERKSTSLSPSLLISPLLLSHLFPLPLPSPFLLLIPLSIT